MGGTDRQERPKKIHMKTVEKFVKRGKKKINIRKLQNERKMKTDQDSEAWASNRECI
jgi:hypothetical protein